MSFDMDCEEKVRRLGQLERVRNGLLFAARLALELGLGALEECLDHVADAFLHLSANRALAQKGCEVVKIAGMRTAQLHVLSDSNENLMATLFKRSSIA